MCNARRYLKTDDIEDYTVYVRRKVSSTPLVFAWDYHTFREALGPESFDYHLDYRLQGNLERTDKHFTPDLRGKVARYNIKIERRPLIAFYDATGTSIYGTPGPAVFAERAAYVASLQSILRDEVVDFESPVVNLKARATIETRLESFPNPVDPTVAEYDKTNEYLPGEAARVTAADTSFATYYCIMKCKDVKPPSVLFWTLKKPVGFRDTDKRSQVMTGQYAPWSLYLFEDATGAYGAYKPPPFATGDPHNWGDPGGTPISFFNPFTVLIDSGDPLITPRFGEGKPMNHLFDRGRAPGLDQ
jgi:hypothetical protein